HERILIVVDPMLATGGSANDAIESLKKRGAKSIKLMCLVAAPEGIKVIQENHPDVDIYIVARDDSLNEDGYIVPGLGDGGYRLYSKKLNDEIRLTKCIKVLSIFGTRPEVINSSKIFCYR